MADLRRAPRLPQELQDQLLKGARAGLPKETVAVCSGISCDELDAILQLGLSSDAPKLYSDFARLYRAQERVEEVNVSLSVVSAAKRDWRAGLAWLAARFPRQWGKDAVTQTAADMSTDNAGEEALAEDLLSSPEFEVWLSQRGFALTKSSESQPAATEAPAKVGSWGQTVIDSQPDPPEER
jgi:hypothetical protein